MKLTFNPNKLLKQSIPTSSDVDQHVDQNPNFSNKYLKQQVFCKPKSDQRQHSLDYNPRQTHLFQEHKKQINGVANSFVMGYENHKMKTQEEESYKKMIIQLSHELLVKDSMIDSLRSLLMGNQGDQSQSRIKEVEDEVIKNKSSYHFKTLIQAKQLDKDLIGRKKSVGGFSIDDKKISPMCSLEDKTSMSQSQFVKNYGKDNCESIRSNKPQSSRFPLKKSSQRTRLQLQQNYRFKQKQYQISLNQKKMLTQKIIQNQQLLISKDVQIKSLKKQLKKGDISKDITKDQINRSIDAKRVIQYQQRITRLKKQNLFLTTHLQQIKKSKREQIQSSISEWKKINQSMHDSLVNLNQQNSVLTKKITDLEIRLTTSCTKVIQLEKQNSTLKYNLENQKNSYSTLSMHHKHEKDQANRRISHVEKQIERTKHKSQNHRIERQRIQVLLKEKQEIINGLQTQIKSIGSKYQSEMSRMKEYHSEQFQHEKSLKRLIQKDLEISNSSLKNMQVQLSKQKQYKLAIQKQLTATLKLASQYKAKQKQQEEEIEHYKNKVSELVQKVSELKIQKGYPRDKGTEYSVEREQTMFQNESLKYKVQELTKQLNENPESSKLYIEELEVQLRKKRELEEVNKRLGEKIRKCELEILSLKSRLNEGTNSQNEKKVRAKSNGVSGSENESHESYSETEDLVIPPNNNYHIVVNHNQILSRELNQRQNIIIELRENLRRQEDNSINLKLHLDDVNKKLVVYLDMIEINNKALISKQLHFGNCTLQAQQIIDQLREDNQNLQKELKVIYQKLEYFERRLECESSEVDNSYNLQQSIRTNNIYNRKDQVECQEDRSEERDQYQQDSQNEDSNSD